MTIIKKVFAHIHLIMVNLAKVLLVLMTIIISAQVFFRYVIGFSLAWSEEIALLIMVWFSFISLSIGTKNKLHICIEAFTQKLPSKIQDGIIMKISDVVVFIIGMTMIIDGFKLSKYGMTSTLAATGLPTAIIYIIIPITGVLVVYDAFMDFFGFEKFDQSTDHGLKEGGKCNA